MTPETVQQVVASAQISMSTAAVVEGAEPAGAEAARNSVEGRVSWEMPGERGAVLRDMHAEEDRIGVWSGLGSIM